MFSGFSFYLLSSSFMQFGTFLVLRNIEKKRAVAPSKIRLLSSAFLRTLCPAEHDYINPLSWLVNYAPGLFLGLVAASLPRLLSLQMYAVTV